MPKSTSKWNDGYYVEIYQLLQAGVPLKDIAEKLNVTMQTLTGWAKKKPALKKLFDDREKISAPSKTVRDYVYKRLDPETKEVWDRLDSLSKMNEDGTPQDNYDAVTAYLDELSTPLKQRLFVHALVANTFSTSKALNRCGISYKTLEGWKNDPAFVKLLEEIDFHKGDFWESKMYELAEQGNAAVVLHGAKTVRKDIFGTDKIEVTGTVNHIHTGVNMLRELDLDADTLKKIVEAMDKKDEVVEEAEFRMLPE